MPDTEPVITAIVTAFENLRLDPPMAGATNMTWDPRNRQAYFNTGRGQPDVIYTYRDGRLHRVDTSDPPTPHIDLYAPNAPTDSSTDTRWLVSVRAYDNHGDRYLDLIADTDDEDETRQLVDRLRDANQEVVVDRIDRTTTTTRILGPEAFSRS